MGNRTLDMVTWICAPKSKHRTKYALLSSIEECDSIITLVTVMVNVMAFNACLMCLESIFFEKFDLKEVSVRGKSANRFV